MADETADEILPLAEVVQGLRSEILKAADAAGHEKIRFGVGPIELEFQVVAKREGGANGSIKFGIWGVGVEAGGSAKIASERTQKVKFTLKPVQVAADGSKTEVEIFKSNKPAGT
jgi:hypothetical protein